MKFSFRFKFGYNLDILASKVFILLSYPSDMKIAVTLVLRGNVLRCS